MVVAACLLALGSSAAKASVSDYQTLYLSGGTSSLLSGSYKLVTSAGPGTPGATPTVTDFFDAQADGLWDCLNYYYVYTKVDATGGETPPSPPVNFFFPTQWAEVGNLPTGVTVRLYRQCDSSPYTRVAELPNNSSPTYDDTMNDATAAGQPVLPQAQNRIPLGVVGYQNFAPGGYADASLDSALDPGPYTTPNGKGWIVDGGGAVSFPTGPWTFKANVQQSGGSGTAHLAVGMWKVTVSGNAITSSTMLLDPTGAGENSTNFISGASIAHAVTVNGFSLAPNEHLYVQFWRRQTVVMASGGPPSTIATMPVYDGTAQITHPAANGFPNVPALGSVAARVKTTPQLSATFSDPDAADTGTLAFQLCSDPTCATVLQSGSSAPGIANGAIGNWTPPTNIADGLHDGTYYWRVQATDSSAGGPNTSGWSSTSSFVVDTVPPGTPTLDLPAAAARVTTTQLGATFVDTDLSDSGIVDFELCSNASCSSVVGSNTSSSVGSGAAVTWTPTGLSDGTYYWRLRATDVAGNQTSWTPTQSFVLDTNPPGVPSLTSPADASYLGAAPALKATFTSSDAGDSGKLDFQVCSDNLCGTVVRNGSSSSGLANGGTGSWTPSGLAAGSYYWRSRAQDAVGNQSAWSAPLSFTLDTTAPTAPGPASVTVPAQTPPQPSATFAAPGAAALVSKPRLSGTFSDADPGDSGTLEFQVCADADCATVVADGSSASVAAGQTGSWTAVDPLDDGVYFWRVRAVDAAGNGSTWSPTRSFTLDQTPPGQPQDFSAHVSGHVLTLTLASADGQREGARLYADRQREEDADPQPEDAQGAHPPAEARQALVRGRRHRHGGEHERGDEDDRHLQRAAVVEAGPLGRAAPAPVAHSRRPDRVSTLEACSSSASPRRWSPRTRLSRAATSRSSSPTGTRCSARRCSRRSPQGSSS